MNQGLLWNSLTSCSYMEKHSLSHPQPESHGNPFRVDESHPQIRYGLRHLPENKGSVSSGYILASWLES